VSGDGFAHLHVASGYSLQYGANLPQVLVERAAEQGMDLLALTDRDGVYGAVKFVKACQEWQVRPILGVDLAIAPEVAKGSSVMSRPARTLARTPVRGGTFRDPPGQSLPRVTLLAAGGSPQGWAQLCRLITTTHLRSNRGEPITTMEVLAPALKSGQILALLGPYSPLGKAIAEQRDDLVQAELQAWLAVTPRENLLLELVSHRLPSQRDHRWGPGTAAHAARMAQVARRAGLGTVLTNAVRYADRMDAPIADILDASRRLVALHPRHLDRVNAEGFLKSGKQMAEVAEEIVRLSGLANDSERAAKQLLAHTRVVAERCALDLRHDLGIGEIYFPEFDVATAQWVRSHPLLPHASPDQILRVRCEDGLRQRYGATPKQVVLTRLHEELSVITETGYASYFLTVAQVTDLIREMGIRSAGRGSGAGSLVNYLLGISGVDPIRHGLMMERFFSTSRKTLPDIDVDVEAARRTEVYQKIMETFGEQRCVCVSMMETYRVRHAVRDVGAALGMPPGEVDVIAKAFPHIRARDARLAMRDLPELRSLTTLKGQVFEGASGSESLDHFFSLVERLDGLPRHIAVHPCGVLLSDTTLLDRTPVESSFTGFPMSQFDKDDVEELGLLKLDVLGIRMQSAMAHAIAEVERLEGIRIDLEDEAQVPFDDPATYELISSARTLGVFQIESPGQRELVGKSGISSFEDIIADISLFRPGPVKSDMITPYLEAKQGWRKEFYLHPDLKPILEETRGVVVYHEQIIEIFKVFTGITRAKGDERRRMLATEDGILETERWFCRSALGQGYEVGLIEAVWKVIASFASFGFCKAHAAAFALPTYQSAWLKTHYPAHFLAGVLTHDPGMYPKRLILDDARQFGIEIRGIDVNVSDQVYRVEPRSTTIIDAVGQTPAIRISLADVKGITQGEIARIVAGRPFSSLGDFWERAPVSLPILERLILIGGFDSIYQISPNEIRRRGAITRRDLLLHGTALHAQGRQTSRGDRARGRSVGRLLGESEDNSRLTPGKLRSHNHSHLELTNRSSATTGDSVQLSLNFVDAGPGISSGLPELTNKERMKAELEILGLDVSQHVLADYQDFLEVVGVTRSRDLLQRRSRSDVLVAGVKVATQTPPVRSGRRVIFVTIDDATGPIDATFFDTVQGAYAETVFGSWLLVIRGELRRTGYRGVSICANGAWDLAHLYQLWKKAGSKAVLKMFTPVIEAPAITPRRVLKHSSGFQMSPYADIKPAGESTKDVARKLVHRSPGSPG
jgi:error-prone DNA polymerase